MFLTSIKLSWIHGSIFNMSINAFCPCLPICIDYKPTDDRFMTNNYSSTNGIGHRTMPYKY